MANVVRKPRLHVITFLHDSRTNRKLKTVASCIWMLFGFLIHLRCIDRKKRAITIKYHCKITVFIARSNDFAFEFRTNKFQQTFLRTIFIHFHIIATDELTLRIKKNIITYTSKSITILRFCTTLSLFLLRNSREINQSQ